MDDIYMRLLERRCMSKTAAGLNYKALGAAARQARAALPKSLLDRSLQAISRGIKNTVKGILPTADTLPRMGRRVARGWSGMRAAGTVAQNFGFSPLIPWLGDGRLRDIINRLYGAKTVNGIGSRPFPFQAQNRLYMAVKHGRNLALKGLGLAALGTGAYFGGRQIYDNANNLEGWDSKGSSYTL